MRLIIARDVSDRLLSDIVLVANENLEDPLLDPDDERSSLNPERREEHQPAVSVPQALVRAEFRRPLAIVCFSMLCQQLSG